MHTDPEYLTFDCGDWKMKSHNTECF
jgi:hypothetical protein